MKIAPAFTLLLVGLIFGLLVAIPIYLSIRAACFWRQLKRKEQTMSRQHAMKEIFVVLLGGISLATLDPVWFKLEITFISILALVASVMSGRPIFSDIEPFPPVSLIGERRASILKHIFIFGLIAAPIVNFWLALQISETAWLLFRTLGLFLWFGGSGALVTWLAHRNAAREVG